MAGGRASAEDVLADAEASLAAVVEAQDRLGDVVDGDAGPHRGVVEAAAGLLDVDVELGGEDAGRVVDEGLAAQLLGGAPGRLEGGEREVGVGDRARGPRAQGVGELLVLADERVVAPARRG